MGEGGDAARPAPVAAAKPGKRRGPVDGRGPAFKNRRPDVLPDGVFPVRPGSLWFLRRPDMSGPIVRTGSNSKLRDGWDRIFADGPTDPPPAAKKAAAKKGAAKTTAAVKKSGAAKKSPAAKATAKKSVGKQASAAKAVAKTGAGKKAARGKKKSA